MKWQTMETAPKDGTLIVGLCEHEADPYFDTATNELTPYGANAEGMGHVTNGAHVIYWAEECSDGDWFTGYHTNIIPAWWTRNGSCGEEAANPIAWSPMPQEEMLLKEVREDEPLRYNT